MVPLSYRRGLLNNARERRWFDELPEDVLILIFSQCCVDELLALRLINSKTRDIIADYIITIAPAVARSTFPNNELLLTPPNDPSQYTISWLKGLIPRHLASILVDRHRFSHEGTELRYGIAAEDPWGDKLRERVANGWRVLKRLANISAEIYRLDAKRMLKSSPDSNWTETLKLFIPSRFEFEVFRRREEMILQRRLEYVNAIPHCDAMDYKLMFILLSSAFRTSISNLGDQYKPWIFDWGCGIDGQRLLRRGNSWLTWFILHEGPDLFWYQWWVLQTKNHICDRSIEAWFGSTDVNPDEFLQQFMPKEWTDVNEKWHNIQRDNAREVQKAMEARVASAPRPPANHFHAISPIIYFTQYAEQRYIQEESGMIVPPVPETLSHVPFHVDFRCPEELFQKHRIAVKERSLVFLQPRTTTTRP